MQPPKLDLATSNTPNFEELPPQIRTPVRASQLPGGDDMNIRRDDADFAQECHVSEAST
jgi:hypothetical protein